MVKPVSTLYQNVLRLTRLHFLYVLAFAGSIIVYDASQLIAPQAVLQRWQLAASLAIITTVCWYLAGAKKSNLGLQKSLVLALVLADIIFASYLVYADRGMASLAVALYALPIASAAVLSSRSAVLAAASLSAAAYAYATVKYFVDFFNEGYKVQLYSTIGFYGVMFFVLAGIIITLIKPSAKK